MLETHGQPYDAHQALHPRDIRFGYIGKVLVDHLAALAQGEHRELFLFLLGKPRQVGIAQYVRGVAVEVLVGNRHADFMRVSRPAQQFPVCGGELPLLARGGEEDPRAALDNTRRVGIHGVALHQRVDGALPDILVGQPAHQVVDHALAQGAAGGAHMGDTQGIEQGADNGHAGQDDIASLGGQALQVDAVYGVELQQFLLQQAQSGSIDAAVAPAVLGEQGIDGAQGARGAHAVLPVAGVELVAHRRQAQARLLIGAAIVLAADQAPRKTGPGKGDAAHLQALQALGLEALADDQFRAASADVDHEAGLHVISQGVRDAQVHQPRLLASVDYVDAGTQDAPRGHRELPPVVGHSQGVGAHGPHPLRFHAAQ